MSRPPATISIDLDPVDLHLEAYGHRGLPADPQVYDLALPRLLERLARLGAQATFFVPARDAGARAQALARVVAAGHEIASHSLTHPLALTRLPLEELRRQLAGSKRALEAAVGRDVVGFRAPNFDVDGAVLREVAAAGYRYDASAYPTPLLLAARLALALKGGDPGGVLRMRLWPRSLARRPRRLRRAGGLVEFPLAVTPAARWPVYHTLYLMSDGPAFLRRIEGFADRGEPFAYTLHAVDALGLAEDGVDPRLAPHPGMGLPLERKLAALDRALGAVAARFEVLTFRARVERGEARDA